MRCGLCPAVAGKAGATAQACPVGMIRKSAACGFGLNPADFQPSRLDSTVCGCDCATLLDQPYLLDPIRRLWIEIQPVAAWCGRMRDTCVTLQHPRVHRPAPPLAGSTGPAGSARGGAGAAVAEPERFSLRREAVIGRLARPASSSQWRHQLQPAPLQ